MATEQKQKEQPSHPQNTKVIMKTYTVLDGSDMQSMMEGFGDMLDTEKEYAMTLLLEEIL